jgi:hypothetical protein
MNDLYSLQRPPALTPKLYDIDEKGDAYEQNVYAHYFLGTSDWFILEYSPEDDIAFCWAELIPDMGELGYVSLKELESLVIYGKIIFNGEVNKYPIRVVFDDDWQPKNLRASIANR